MFTLTAAASLLLCFGTVGLWVRSYFVTDSLLRRSQWSEDTITYRVRETLTSGRGSITFERFSRSGQSLSSTVPDVPRWRGVPTTPVAQEPRSDFEFAQTDEPPFPFEKLGPSFLGFGGYSIESPQAGERSVLWIWAPHWSPPVLFGILPMAWVIIRRRQRLRGQDGRCATCGYDLRATPGRCPECGTVPTAADVNARWQTDARL